MMHIDFEYQKTIQWMFEQLPFFTRIGAAAYKPNLDNIIQLCKRIGEPQSKFKSIHIAGTNGKGSCSNMLACLFQKAGYKTGLYTSPHIVDFRERIKLNGIDISKENVVSFVEKNKSIIDEIKPSFFEITVAIAFDIFAKEKVDIAIIEVGLGGLLDSTNIIQPELSIITNISKDHTQFLGDTLQQIAIQKAGIIKDHTPILIGETNSQTEKIFITHAIKHQSPIFFADQRFETVFAKTENDIQELKIVDQSQMKIHKIETDLLGAYQSKNIQTVLNAIEILKTLGWDFSSIDYQNVFKDTKSILNFKGRFDIVSHSPNIVLDASHNEAGITELLHQATKKQKGNLHFVLGFVQDKDIHKILSLFPKKAFYYFVNAPIPRALHSEELRNQAQELGLIGNYYSSVTEGIKTVYQQAIQEDDIYIAGSFFILEEAYFAVEQILKSQNLKK